MGSRTYSRKGVATTAGRARAIKGIDLANFGKGDNSTTPATVAQELNSVLYGDLVDRLYNQELARGTTEAIDGLIENGNQFGFDDSRAEDEDTGTVFGSELDVWNAFVDELKGLKNSDGEYNLGSIVDIAQLRLDDIADGQDFVNPRGMRQGFRDTTAYRQMRDILNIARKAAIGAQVMAYHQDRNPLRNSANSFVNRYVDIGESAYGGQEVFSVVMPMSSRRGVPANQAQGRVDITNNPLFADMYRNRSVES